MGFFGNNKKRVIKSEMKEIMNNLYSKLDKRERDEVEKLFRADLMESGNESGISREEFDNTIKWLEENKRKHVLEDSDIENIKKYFEEHLKD